MNEYVTFTGEVITVGSIVECTVRLPVKHRLWGIVEAIYPAGKTHAAHARVRDLDGKAENLPLSYLVLTGIKIAESVLFRLKREGR